MSSNLYKNSSDSTRLYNNNKPVYGLLSSKIFSGPQQGEELQLPQTPATFKTQKVIQILVAYDITRKENNRCKLYTDRDTNATVENNRMICKDE